MKEVSAEGVGETQPRVKRSETLGSKNRLNRRSQSSQRLLVDKGSSFITFVNFAAFCSNDLSPSVIPSLFPPFAPVQDLLRSLRSFAAILSVDLCAFASLREFFLGF